MAGGAGGDAGGTLRMDVGLFAASACLLTLEILQTKIFAYSLPPMTIYLAVGMCLLGLGASAVLLALAPRLASVRARHWASLAALCAALTIPASHMVFADMAETLYRTPGAATYFVLAALTVPYLFLGFVIALALVDRAEGVGRAYASNMAGSGFGCLLVFPLLEGLGAEGAVVAVAWIALLAAVILQTPRGRGVLALVAVTAVVLAGAQLRATQLLPFPPDAFGQIGATMRAAAFLTRQNPGERVEVVHEFKRWDRTGRADVYRIDSTISAFKGQVGGRVDTRVFVHDGSTGSFLIGVRDDVSRGAELFEKTVYGAGYQLGPVGDVMIIGLGGAPDVLAALHYGAENIIGVELNQAVIDFVREDYAEFLGDPYGQPNVEVLREGGRTFLARPGETYDLIQLTGVDVKDLFAGGTLAMSSTYLYTREAAVQLLSRLRPDGLLAIIRLSEFETTRTVTTLAQGFADLGVADPRQHMMVMENGPWGCVLVKRSPFTQEQVDTMRAWIDRHQEEPKLVIPSFDLIRAKIRFPLRARYLPGEEPLTAGGYYQAFAAGRLPGFLARAKEDLSPPTDDRPFFFFADKPADVFSNPASPVWRLLRVAGQLSVVAAAFIFLPLIALRRGLRAQRAGRSLVYFTSLGLGFMLVEIGLIQRFVLLLGHESYAITVVLFGLLLGAALGSLTSGRLGVTSRGPITAALTALLVVVFAYAYGLATVFDAAIGLSFPARLAIALGLLVLLGFFLGIPFPLALRSVGRSSSALVAWGIGVNGMASVVGATVAVPVTLVAGHRALILLGAIFYLLAMASAPMGAVRAAEASTGPAAG